MALQKSEKLKKSELFQDYNKFMRGMDKADQIFHCYPCCRKTVNGLWIFFLLHVAAVNSFILFKKIHHKLKPRGRGCAFSDFTWLCLEYERSRKEKTRKIVQMMNLQGLTSTALTMRPCKIQSVKYSADHLQGGPTIHKMLHITPSKKN